MYHLHMYSKISPVINDLDLPVPTYVCFSITKRLKLVFYRDPSLYSDLNRTCNYCSEITPSPQKEIKIKF